MKTKLFTLSLMLFGLGTAFASTDAKSDSVENNTMNPTQNPKVAIVSIYCNKEIAAGDFTGLGAAITKLANDEDFNLEPMAKEIHRKVFSDYTANLEYDFLSEEEVLNNPKYEKSLFEAATWKGNWETRDAWYLRPDGYLPISTYPGKKVARETYSRFEGIDGIMMVSLSYELEKQSQIAGFGTAKIKAVGTIRILGPDGKKLFKVVQYASSKSKVKFAFGGVFKTEELMPMCEEATKLLFEKMDARILKKNAKKKK